MKKVIQFAILFAAVCFASCNSCKKSTVPAQDFNKGNLVVENVISTDKEYMFTHYNKDYRWFETCIVLTDYLDSENCDGTIASIKNIFQVLSEQDSTSCDVNVVMTTHTPDTTNIDVIHGFWVEDMPLNDQEIKVTFKEAYDKVMATNSKKPHSKNIVLRKEVGPKDAAVQYIFGNSYAQLYVNAVTGEVSDKNPVYPDTVKKPLGEWP